MMYKVPIFYIYEQTINTMARTQINIRITKARLFEAGFC